MSLLSPPLSAEPIRWDENGHYYEIVAVPGGITWWEAQQAAVARGGHLVTIQSAAENDFVFQNLASNPAYWQLGLGAPYQNQAAGPWIGAFQPPHAPAPNAAWQWVNGDGSLEETYANWLHAEPNGDGGTVGGVALFYDNNINDPPMITSQWNDWQATNRAPHTSSNGR